MEVVVQGMVVEVGEVGVGLWFEWVQCFVGDVEGGGVIIDVVVVDMVDYFVLVV